MEQFFAIKTFNPFLISFDNRNWGSENKNVKIETIVVPDTTC